MSDQHGAVNAAHVQVVDDSESVGGESASRTMTGAVTRSVCRDSVQLRGQPFGNLMPVGRRPGLTMQQHQLVTTERGQIVSAVSMKSRGSVLSIGHPLGRPAARCCVGPAALAAPEDQEDQPAGQCDQPEAGKAVEQHRSQRLAGAQTGGDEREAHGTLGNAEPARSDVQTLRRDTRAVDKQEIIPGNGAASGADAHDEDCRVSEPVDHAQAGHRDPGGWRKPERAQPFGPGPDYRAGIIGRPA